MIPHKNYKFFFSVHSVKMCNISQNNGIKSINKEVSLLEDRLQINKKKCKSISKCINLGSKIMIKTRTKDKSF